MALKGVKKLIDAPAHSPISVSLRVKVSDGWMGKTCHTRGIICEQVTVVKSSHNSTDSSHSTT